MSEVEQTEQVENVDLVIRTAFDEAVEESKDEDSVKMDMIGAGATFKNVTRLYNSYMIDAGLQMSKEEKDDIVSSTLEGADLDTEDGFNTAVESLVDSLTDATERSAASIIRAFGKKNKLEVYTKPKSSGGSARNPFVNLFHEALIENPQMTEDDLRELIGGLSEENQVNPNRWFNQHNNIRKTANAIAAKYA